MRGLETLKAAYQDYKQSGGKKSEEEYIEFVKGACLWVADGINNPECGDILINDLARLRFRNNKLRDLIIGFCTRNNMGRLTESLKKLENDDREVYRGFLSRIEHFEVNGGFPFRRGGALREGSEDNH